MQTRFLTLAKSSAHRDAPATVMAGAGALERAMSEHAQTVIVDWSGDLAGVTARAVQQAIEHDATLVSLDPVTAPLLGSLAAACRLHVCIHNAPGTFEGWFKPSTFARLGSLLRALGTCEWVTMSAGSERQARAHELDLGLPKGAIAPWPSGVEAPQNEAISAGPITSVAVVARLSREKEPLLRAAAELVAAGRELGRAAVLEVFGDGPAESHFRELLATTLPAGAWRLHGAVDRPLNGSESPDVLVGMGRSALEGLVAGRRVVAARWSPRPHGQLGPVVTAANLDEISALTFSWADRAPLDPREVWRDLESLRARDVAAVRDLARARYSAQAMYDRLLEILAAGERPAGEVALARALAADGVALEQELQRVAAVADGLWMDLEWRRTQRPT